MKVMVMGAGGQGGPAVSILSKDPEITEIVLADFNIEAANQVKERVKSEKVTVKKVNAKNVEEIAAAMEGASFVVDLVLPFLAQNVMQACLITGTNYANTAFDTPFWEELSAEKPLSFDKEFKEKGLTALLGCGMAPGFLNVVTRKYVDKLDTVESIKLRLAKKNTTDPEFSDVVGVWNPGWAPRQALLDCANPAICFDQGKYGFVDAYAGIEEWDFPEPVGTKLVSHHSHEEPYSMPYVFKDKGIQYCDFKYYITAQAATLVKMGFASDEYVDVKGVSIKPIDFVETMIPKPGNNFIDENYDVLDSKDKTAFVAMFIEIIGEKGGEKKKYKVHIPNLNKPGKQLFDKFGTALLNVALPVVTGAKLISQSPGSGVIFAEELDPDLFLNMFKDSGHPCTIEEL